MKRKKAIAADIIFEVESDNQATTVMLNTILALMTAIKEFWSDGKEK